VEAGRARAAELTAESAVLRQAQAHAEDTVAQARERALEMRAGARGYADDLLARAESGLKRLLEEVQANRAQLGPPA
jgi:cell division septum initiation protein DivIVA